MKKFLIQAIGLVLIIAFALLFYSSSKSNPINVPFFPQPKKQVSLQVGSNTLSVEVADTADKRSKGLSDRENLASNSGMLFVFDKEGKYPFWMKGMKFGLDFIWIGNGAVAEVNENIPAPLPNQPDSSLTIYPPGQPVSEMLEVNAGTVKRLNIKVGDSIKVLK